MEPVLELLGELDGNDAGDVPFVLAALRVRDRRVLEALTRRLENDPQDAALCLEMYGDPAAIPALEAALAKIPADDPRSRAPIQAVIEGLSAPAETSPESDEPFDIWALYPEEAATDFGALEDEDRLAMLQKGSPSLRADVALSYQGTDLSDDARARLIQLAKTDPDAAVRGACWEALGEIGDEPDLRQAMLKVLADPKAAIEERSGAAIGLAEQSDNAAVYQAILNLYQDPRGRAKALKAMARSFDKRFSAYPPKHLDDPDPDIKTQAIWGIGYLDLASEAPRLVELFDDEEFRTDALFAYALSIPGETSPGRVRALMTKVEQAAGGFREDEEDLVRIALDQRLMLHGKSPVFFPGRRGRRGRTRNRDRGAEAGPQRPVLLRQRQEVQEVPRPGELVWGRRPRLRRTPGPAGKFRGPTRASAAGQGSRPHVESGKIEVCVACYFW